MVVVIISIIAAIAVPRVSNAGKNAETESIRATITNVCGAIDHFNAEHGRFPGFNPANGNPNGEWFVKQLTMYSDADGNVDASLGGKFIFGPYLHAPFPTNPHNGLNTVNVKEGRAGAVALNSSGWIAVLDDGAFTINTKSELIRGDAMSEAEVLSIDALRSGN